jgi:hypothetical protein
MDLDIVVHTTLRVLETTDPAKFQPTLLDPAKRTIRCLAGVPDNVDHAIALQDWVKELGLTEYGAAFRCRNGIGIAAICADRRVFAMLSRTDGSWSVSDCEELF